MEQDWIFGAAKAELAEKDNAYQIQVALPGFDAKDVQVTAATREIVVHATTQAHKSETSPTVVWSEFGSSEVLRRFELPQPVALDKVCATLEKGILRITAPCASQSKPATAQKQTKVVAA
jgi:HSP20 family protein